MDIGCIYAEVHYAPAASACARAHKAAVIRGDRRARAFFFLFSSPGFFRGQDYQSLR